MVLTKSFSGASTQSVSDKINEFILNNGYELISVNYQVYSDVRKGMVHTAIIVYNEQ